MPVLAPKKAIFRFQVIGYRDNPDQRVVTWIGKDLKGSRNDPPETSF